MGITRLEAAVLDRVRARRDALLDDLRRHVALPTGGENRHAIEESAALLTLRASALGATLHTVPGQPRPPWINAWRATDPDAALRSHSQAWIPPVWIARRTGPAQAGPAQAGPAQADPPPAVLIAGHLDTVHEPGSGFSELSIAPGGLTATGPGCVDMKGGLVIAIHALEALDDAGAAPRWTLLLNADEESGSYHSDDALRHEARRALGSGAPAYHAALALEPAAAGGAIVTSRGGSGAFMIRARGRSAHVGRDFPSGVSAVDALARQILRVHALSDPARGLCVNVSPIWSRAAPNVVADSAHAWGNARFPTPDQGRSLLAALGAIQTPPDALPAIELTASFQRPAKPATDRTQALLRIVSAAANDLGQPLPTTTTAGVCDGNNLQDARAGSDQPLAVLDTLGVRGGGLHTPQEWIELPSLVERCQLLALTIARLQHATL